MLFRAQYCLAQTHLHPTGLHYESIQNNWYNSKYHCYKRRRPLASRRTEFKHEPENKANVVYVIKTYSIGRAQVASSERQPWSFLWLWFLLVKFFSMGLKERNIPISSGRGGFSRNWGYPDILCFCGSLCGVTPLGRSVV